MLKGAGLNIRNVSIFFCVLLTACQVITSPSKDMKVAKDYSQSTMPLVHYSSTSGQGLFYTYPFNFSDLNESEILQGVNVQLKYENECIYFQYGPHKAVPLLPYGVSSWDKKNQTLKYFNVIYQVGDTISAGGTLTSKDNPNGYILKGLKTTPSDKCNLDKILVLFGLPDGRALHDK